MNVLQLIYSFQSIIRVFLRQLLVCCNHRMQIACPRIGEIKLNRSKEELFSKKFMKLSVKYAQFDTGNDIRNAIWTVFFGNWKMAKRLWGTALATLRSFLKELLFGKQMHIIPMNHKNIIILLFLKVISKTEPN